MNEVLHEIEGCLADLLSERGAYMNRCRAIRERITAAYDQAKDAGLPRKALKTLVKNREAVRKIEERIAALEEDEAANYAALQAALGDFADTPLGEAAMSRAKPKSEGDTLDSLRQ